MTEAKTRGGTRRRLPVALALSVVVLLAPELAHAAGELDPSFGNGGRVMATSGHAWSVAIDSRGRIVTSGHLSHPDAPARRASP